MVGYSNTPPLELEHNGITHLCKCSTFKTQAPTKATQSIQASIVMPTSNPIVVALCNVMQSRYQTKVAGFTLSLDEQTIICFRILLEDMSNDSIYVEQEYITNFA